MNNLSGLIEAVTRGDLAAVKSILDADGTLLNKTDESGATSLHYAAFTGHRDIVRFLIGQGADPNLADAKFGATPAGWAIEYIRELGGYLATDLADFAYAIRQGDVRWVERLLRRFPDLRDGKDTSGKPFRLLAQESAKKEIVELFDHNGRTR